MSHGYYIEAEYESGYIHRETDEDHSPYSPGRNFFYDILHNVPTENGHGRMVRFSLLNATPDSEGQLTRYDVDWTQLPDDAVPIHYMKMQRSISITGPQDGDSGPYCVGRGFGFSYKDPETGEEIQKIEEIAD